MVQKLHALNDLAQAELNLEPDFSRAEFDGYTYEPEFDQNRLRGEMSRVYRVIKDGDWHTLSEISFLTGDPEAGISARLRDLRKKKFGGHVVNRRRRGDPKHGLFEYQFGGKAA